MDRGAWRAIVHGAAKSWTRLSGLTHAHTLGYRKHRQRTDMNVTAPRAVSKPLTGLLPENRVTFVGSHPAACTPHRLVTECPLGACGADPGLGLRRSYQAGPWAPPRTPDTFLPSGLTLRCPDPAIA